MPHLQATNGGESRNAAHSPERLPLDEPDAPDELPRSAAHPDEIGADVRTRSARTFALDKPEAGRPRDARHGTQGRAARSGRATSRTDGEDAPQGTGGTSGEVQGETRHRPRGCAIDGERVLCAIIRGMGIQAYIYQDESGAFCADVPALPGCHSCGDTFEEAQANIREAALLWIETANEEAAGNYANAERVAL